MTTSKKYIALIDSFTAYLRQCNMRVTSERLAVVEVMSKHTGLFTAEELHRETERDAFPVSVATIYNTLSLLVEAGLLKCLRLPDSPTALYQLAAHGTNHIYYICEECGRIRQGSTKEVNEVLSKHDFRSFTPRSFSLNIYGLCRKCAKAYKNADKK